MIYTNKTQDLQTRYRKAKEKRKECLSKAKNIHDRQECWVDYYSKIVDLINLNIKMLYNSGQLTPKRNENLTQHLEKARKHLEYWKKVGK